MPISRFLLLTLLACACSAPREDRTAVARYASATLTPGVGLGDLELGVTTLGSALDRLGAGQVSVLVGDETALELSFADRALALLFIVEGSCKSALDGGAGRSAAMSDLKAFAGTNAACRDMLLSSVAVSAAGEARSKDDFFRGATDEGVGLWSELDDVVAAHGEPVKNAGHLVAGERPDALERTEFETGLYVYYRDGLQPTAAEMRSGRPLAPERLQELEASRAADSLRVIRRMAIFIP